VRFAVLAFAVLVFGCDQRASREEHSRLASPQESASTPSASATAASDPPSGTQAAGRWSVRRAREPDLAIHPQTRQQLQALGYADGTQAAVSDVGVLTHVAGKAQAGLNFCVSGHMPGAFLMDMDGNVLHEWRFGFREAFPDFPVELNLNIAFWRRAHLFPNGDVLAVFEALGLIKLDRDSRLLWARQNNAHHSVHVMPDGEIYVLTHKIRRVPSIDPTALVREDFISVLDPNGDLKWEVSLLESFERSDYKHILEKRRFRVGDIFHTNELRVLDGRFVAKQPAFERGNVLVSMCYLDAVAVVDPRARKVVWAHQGSYRCQHDPRILDSGNLLLFDNRGRENASAVYEFDVATMEPVWVYEGDPPTSFYTHTSGAAERLPNGNTLITESEPGRAFEVTPEKQIVWEFVNPNTAGAKGELIANLFQVTRLPESFPTAWLDRAPAAP